MFTVICLDEARLTENNVFGASCTSYYTKMYIIVPTRVFRRRILEILIRLKRSRQKTGRKRFVYRKYG